MVVCVHFPRFELAVAVGHGSRLPRRAGMQALDASAGQALLGRALAIAPQPGAEQRLGEVSGAAEAYGVQAGMALGEALARCPELILLAPDPVGVADTWEGILRKLEALGASVEAECPGRAYFVADGLRGLHGTDAATIAAASQASRVAASRASCIAGEAGGGGQPARIGAGPTRFCALAAALAARSLRPFAVGEENARRWLAGRSIGLLSYRRETEAMVAPLERLGVRVLGELVRMGAATLTDRFGTAGAFAYRLAGGEDTCLRPRRVEERLRETMSVGDASSGPALERVLGVLVDRLLARPERRGRALRAVALGARLVEGGAWRERVVFRQALADPQRIALALTARLGLLPAPAAVLVLTVERFGCVGGGQQALQGMGPADPAAGLGEAVAQMRAIAGRDAALRAVCVDLESRVPERRVLLTPLPG
jgi:nucleotidyltransferase/DNA polymerase involved in DNA repair